MQIGTKVQSWLRAGGGRKSSCYRDKHYSGTQLCHKLKVCIQTFYRIFCNKRKVKHLSDSMSLRIRLDTLRRKRLIPLFMQRLQLAFAFNKSPFLSFYFIFDSIHRRMLLVQERVEYHSYDCWRSWRDLLKVLLYTATVFFSWILWWGGGQAKVWYVGGLLSPETEMTGDAETHELTEWQGVSYIY